MSDQNSWDNEDLQKLQSFWSQPDANNGNNNGNNNRNNAGNGPTPGTPPHFANRGAMPPGVQGPGQLNNWNLQTNFSQTGSFHNGWADALDFNDRPGGSNSY